MAYERKCVGETNPLRIRLSLYLLMINGLCAYLCPGAEPLVVDLLWQPEGSVHASVRIEEDVQTPFPKEPDFEGRQVVRGLLPCAERQYMAYVWDCNESRLYMDKNRNGDLTDDPTGIYESRHAHYRRGSSSQFFDDIEITLPRESITHEYVIYFNFQGCSPDRIWRSIFVKSAFSALMELEGETWHVEVADNMDGMLNNEDRLHILPYQAGRKEELNSGLPLQETLFLDGRFYHCDYRFVANSDQSAKLKLSLTQQEAPRDLKIVFKAEKSSGRHRPKMLAMDFKIVGSGDETYWSFGRNSMPKFTIFKEENKAYTGTLDRINGYRYSDTWHVPIYLSGKMKIVASCELDSLGHLESEPVFLNWKVWKATPEAWIFLPLILAIVLIRANWSLQVLWLAVPLVSARLGIHLLGEMTDISSDMVGVLEFISLPMAIGLSVVLLLGDKLGRLRKTVAWGLVLLILGATRIKSFSHELTYSDVSTLMIVMTRLA